MIMNGPSQLGSNFPLSFLLSVSLSDQISYLERPMMDFIIIIPSSLPMMRPSMF
nr:hypothetical protein Q903MT_gene1225 [Picea sitchensis]